MKVWKFCVSFLICLSIPANVHGQKPVESFEMQVKPIGKEVLFKNVLVTGKNGTYLVKGKARSQQNGFYYSVEDGHYILVKEQHIKVNEKYPAWSTFSFEVNVAKEKLPENGTLVLHLYEKDPKDNSMQHVFPVILETF
jgi:hypothetical protein